MRKRTQTPAPSDRAALPTRRRRESPAPAAGPVFVPVDVDVFTRMAWDCLSGDTPLAKRQEAVALGRSYLAEAIALPLKTLSIDDLALAILHLRCSLAQLLNVIAHHTAVRPAEPGRNQDPDDLVADLIDVIAASAPLNAGIDIDIAQPLPAHLIDTLVRAIGSPGPRWSGAYAEAIGSCGTSAIRVAATCLAGA